MHPEGELAALEHATHCPHGRPTLVRQGLHQIEKDFKRIENYTNCCDYFLFDTKTNKRGGSGQQFKWSLLNAYNQNTPFLLSGGISTEDIAKIHKINLSQSINEAKERGDIEELNQLLKSKSNRQGQGL